MIECKEATCIIEILGIEIAELQEITSQDLLQTDEIKISQDMEINQEEQIGNELMYV